MEFKYNDGGRAIAGYKGSAGDCVCRAICIATGKPYEEVYEILAQGNKTQRKGKREGKSKAGKKTANLGINTTRKWFADYMASLGFTWTPTMFIGQGCKVHLCKEELPSGTLIVNVSKHFTTVIDGVIHDTFNPQRGKPEQTINVDETTTMIVPTVPERCVYGYYSKQNN